MRPVIGRMQVLYPLVVGSQNWNPVDRSPDGFEIRTLQIVDRTGEIKQIKLGSELNNLSSITWLPADWHHLYVAIPSQVYRIDLLSKSVRSLDICGLSDVHEIDFIDGNLWIANTGNDEIVAFDVHAYVVCERINLRFLHVDSQDGFCDHEELEIRDEFHVNQTFNSLDGDLHALVHDVTGSRELSSIRGLNRRLQGSGGVVDIRRKTVRNLHLKATHTVRIIEGNYWIFDSGRTLLKIFDSQWRLINSIGTSSFGRGGFYDAESGTYSAGMSVVRKRYQDLIRGAAAFNEVQVFSCTSLQEIGRYAIPHVEQLNCINRIGQPMADALIDFSSSG